MSNPRAHLRVLLPAFAALLALAFAASAQADYEQVGLFAIESAEAEQFRSGYQEPSGGAVNLTGVGGVEPGSVYFSVGGISGSQIARYSPTGQFQEAWGWGMTKNGGPLNDQFERCGPALGTECRPVSSASAGGISEELTTYCGAATDPAGDLYVVDREGAGRVYGPSGSLLSEFKFGGGQEETCNLAVDSSGAIYAVVRQTRLEAASVRKLAPVGGEYPPTPATEYAEATTIYGSRGFVAGAPAYGIASIAIDPANQHLYATEAANDEMQEFKVPTESFKLKCQGDETATLPANAREGEIKAALEAAPVSCGTVKIAGSLTHYEFEGWRVTFEGPLANTHVAPLEVIKAGGNEEATELTVGSSSPHVSVYESNGTRLNTIEPTISGASYYGIGVYGANGDVYVADKAHDKAYVLSSAGALKAEITGSGCEKGAFGAMEDPSLAVDQSNGNVLVSDIKAHGVIDEFSSSGSCLLSVNRPFSEAGPSQIAIDNSGGANDRVAYVASKNGSVSSVYGYAPPSGSSRAALSGLSHETPGSLNSPKSIAIDQQTGDVYVLNSVSYKINTQTPTREHDLIEVFSADGSELIAHFGDAALEGETIGASPEKINASLSIAVDESGKVYVGTGFVNGFGEANRVMCFGPESPGDYHHYAYCGRSQDVKPGIRPGSVALDDAGHLYVGEPATINEFSSAAPTAALLCTYNTHGQAHGMTVNPQAGEVFYFNSSASDKKVHRLKPCDPAAGTFEEAQSPIAPLPETQGIRAMAFNPTFFWGSGRPPGVLYAADAANHTVEGVTHQGIGDVFAQAEVHPPAVLSESVSNTRTTSTVLHAEIDPRGHATNYIFQYLTEAEYEANETGEHFAGAMEAPAGGGEIGSGGAGHALVAVTGLTPDTAYRFRVIATSECDEETGEPCVTEGEALPFATYPLFPPGLPDHRAYELVSPAQKHGGEVIPAEPTVSSCGANCKPSSTSFGFFFPMQSSSDGEALAYVGQPFNTSEGAINFDSYVSRRTEAGWQSTALIPALPLKVNQLAFDSGLEHGLLSPPSSNQLEIQDASEPGSATPLITETNHRGASELQLSYAGHSADFSRQFFAANDSLSEATPFAPEPPDPGVAKKDLYEWQSGQLALVNVLPGNETIAVGAKFASLSPDTHPVSQDGSRVFFTDEAANRLYVRESGEVTRLIEDSGHFLSASADGSEVLLTDGCLYAVEAGSCTDLTEGHGGFQGLVGQSTDLSHLYFVDTAVLGDGEPNEAGEVAEAGKGNLYSWSEGAASFIAQLVAKGEASNGNVTDGEDWAANPAARTAEASPDGRFLAFASIASLTGYDNVGLCGRTFNLKLGEYEDAYLPCNEAFLYDSATGKLACASCNPTGEAPLGKTTMRRIEGAKERLPQPRYLTDEGRLYFDSQDSLVARDTNEGVEDVYEYSPQGTGAEGTCEREAGCTRLISAGTEAVDSNLIAVDETGKNVFFDTRDRLALKDKDELLDIYDAREGGGIGAETEISRAECQGENCQAPVTPPNDPTPASSSFEGAGNVKESSTAKKHKKHAKKKHKRHSKKHSKKHKKARKHARTAKRNHGGAK